MKLHLCLAAFLMVFPLQAGEETPSWNELEKLIGSAIPDESFQKFAKSHDLSEVVKGESGNFTPHDQSYSLNFEENHINCVILHVEPLQKDYQASIWTGYAADLPFGLKRLYARKDVIGLLGSPDTITGNFWQVGNCELRISFSKNTGLIQEIYVWKKSKAQKKKTA